MTNARNAGPGPEESGPEVAGPDSDRPQAGWPPDEARRLLDILGDACLAADQSGHIVYANAAADDLLGWPKGGLAGQPISMVVPPGLRGWQVGASGSIIDSLVQIVGRNLRLSSLRQDGTEIPTDMTISVVPWSDGPIVLATMRRRDVGHLSRWSQLTANLFDTLSGGDPGGSPDAVLLEVLGHELGFEMTTLWGLNLDGEPYCREVWTDPHRDPTAHLRVARSPDSWVGVNLPQHVLATGEPLWVPDLSSDLRFARGPAARAGLATAVVFPVRYGGKVVGVIELLSTDQKPGDPGLVDLVRAVSRPAGELLLALRQSSEREQLVRDLESARQRQDFVLRASRVVSEMTDYAATLNRLAEVAVPMLGDLCLIDLVDEYGSFTRMVCHHHDPARAELCEELRTGYAPDPDGDHPTIAVARDRRSRWSAEMSEEFLRATTRDERHFEIVKILQFTSYMAVPLVAGERVLGTLTLVSAGSGRRFTESDLEWAEQLARQVASVVDRARLHERDQNISHTLQHSLLPDRLPRVEGVALDARYLPATAATEVGGDWYDAIVTGNRLYLVVGDVEGHDMSAASIMGKLRHGLALLLGEGLSPSVALDRLNQFAIRTETDRLATVLVVSIDPSAAELRIASAGHIPPMIRSPAGTDLVSLVPAPPIGVPSDADWAEVTVSLPSGDVILFTDGLVERIDLDLGQRLDELIDVIRRCPPGPTALCDQVLATMLPGDERSDDVAVVVASLTY